MVYNYVDVKKEIVETLRRELHAQGFANIRVLKSDPKEVVEIPCICINRASDNESSQVLGEDFGTVKVNEDTWVSFQGTYFDESLEIRGWFKNSEERDDVYPLVKATLFSMRSTLAEKGVLNIKLSGGRDEQDNTFQPFQIYWFSIIMSYLNPLEVEAELVTNKTIDVVNKLMEGASQ